MPSNARELGDLARKFDQATNSIVDLEIGDHLQPSTDNSYDLGHTDFGFRDFYLKGAIKGPETFTIDPSAHGDNTGTLVVKGNLQVDGTTTTINSTTVQVDDTLITLASGAVNAAAADGSGIEVDVGTNDPVVATPTITYDATSDLWNFNKPISILGTAITDGSGNILNSVLNIGGSLEGPLSDLTVQYGVAYSGTPIQGSFFFDSLNQKLKVYTGSSFVDAVPSSSGSGTSSVTDANTTFRNYTYTVATETNAFSGSDDTVTAAGSFLPGHKYTIVTVGDTDFTAIGASANTVGVEFIATDVGSGTGEASETLFYTVGVNTSVVAFVNGVKQVYGSGNDYVATTGTSVTFTYNIPVGSVVEIQIYELLTNDAYYVKSEVYTKAETNTQIASAFDGAVVINESGADADFRVESDTNANAFFLQGSNGNVGIGTSTPNTSLHLLYTNNSGTNYLNADAGILVTNQGSNGSTIKLESNGNFIYGSGSSTLIISDRQNERMRITSNGNVGIGTTTPGVALDVTGSARVSNSLSIGTGGNYEAGSIYSDGNWGMIFRAKAANPNTAEFRWANSADTELMRIDTSGGLRLSGNIYPSADNSYDLGLTGTRWANIYTNDLHLSNEGKEGGNEIDGTTGDWTIQEGSDDLYLLNNKNGKRYKFTLQEVQ